MAASQSQTAVQSIDKLQSPLAKVASNISKWHKCWNLDMCRAGNSVASTLDAPFARKQCNHTHLTVTQQPLSCEAVAVKTIYLATAA